MYSHNHRCGDEEATKAAVKQIDHNVQESICVVVVYWHWCESAASTRVHGMKCTSYVVAMREG